MIPAGKESNEKHKALYHIVPDGRSRPTLKMKKKHRYFGITQHYVNKESVVLITE